MHEAHRAFMDWARSYDHALAPVRSLDLHERWMPRLACPILRLEGSRPVEELRDLVVARGTEHRPCADRVCHVLLIEPRGVVNTGDAGSERRAANDVWI
jgi:hypothetical protein